MNLDESRQRGGVEGNRIMAERITQAAVAKQEQWTLDAATAIEIHCVTASGGRGHPEILAELERNRSGGYRAA